MRRYLLPLPALLLVSACVTGPADGSGKIQTSSQAKRESVQGAVSAPLRDVNLLQTKIPPVLLEAMADPYKRPQPATCAGITDAVVPLNNALGADLDEPVADQLPVGDPVVAVGEGAADAGQQDLEVELLVDPQHQHQQRGDAPEGRVPAVGAAGADGQQARAGIVGDGQPRPDRRVADLRGPAEDQGAGAAAGWLSGAVRRRPLTPLPERRSTVRA